FRGRAGWGARFLGTGTSVLRARERRHARVSSGEAVHLHAAPGRAVERAQDAVVDSPAPPPDRPVESRLPERGRPVQRVVETTARPELLVDGLHQVPAEQVVTAVPLVEERRMVEERLHEEQILPEETTEILHGVEDAPKEAEPGPDLARGQPGHGGPPLFGEIPRQRPEQGLLTVVVPIDPEP